MFPTAPYEKPQHISQGGPSQYSQHYPRNLVFSLLLSLSLPLAVGHPNYPSRVLARTAQVLSRVKHTSVYTREGSIRH